VAEALLQTEVVAGEPLRELLGDVMAADDRSDAMTEQAKEAKEAALVAA
jgi:hypothetical protein